MDATTRRRYSAVAGVAACAVLVIGSAPGDAQRAAQQLPGSVAPAPNACLPGTGSRSWCGDGGAATSAKLASPQDVAVAADGALVIADTANNVIRRVGPDGVISTLAGDGRRTSRAPRAVEPAASPRFRGPTGVAVAPDGTVLVADTGNGAIRRIAHDGRVRTVLGSPRLVTPTDVVALPNGDMLVADAGARRIVRVTAAGAVVLVAGTGQFGSSGDGGPATAATFQIPDVLAALPDGGVLIGDTLAGAVRKVDPAGTISTVAQVGRYALQGVAAAPDGAVVVSLSEAEGYGASTSTEIVRLESGASRIAGTGSDGFTGDDPATAVALDQPRQLAFTPDGSLLVVDSGNDRIRRLTAGGLVTVAGSDRPERAVASVPPTARDRRPPKGRGRIQFRPPNAGVPRAKRAECYDPHERFDTFNFAPPDTKRLPAGRKKVTLRIVTSVVAKVVIDIRRGKRVVKHEEIGRVSNARDFTPVTLVVTLKKGSPHYAEMDGRSVKDPNIYRCDRRRLRVP